MQGTSPPTRNVPSHSLFGWLATFEPMLGSSPLLWRCVYGIVAATVLACDARLLWPQRTGIARS